MDRKLINPQIVTDIADAIRAKKGTSSPIVVSDLATEIASIQSMPQSTKDLATLVGGSTATDEITTNNDLAKGLTDTPETYTFSEQTTAEGGSIKDTIAFVDKVKGNCIKVNQIVVNQETGTEVTYNNTQLVKNFETSNTKVVGHKYAIFFKANSSVAFTMRCRPNLAGSYQDVAISVGNKCYVAFVTIASSDTIAGYSKIVSSGMITGSVSIKDAMLFDLTAMGCESFTTANELAQYFGYADIASMPYMEYSASCKVLNSNNKSICSTSRNLWDEVMELGEISASNGQNVASTSNIRSKNYIPVRGGVKVWAYLGTGATIAVRPRFYDADKQFLSYGTLNTNSYSLSVPSGASYMRFALNVSDYGSTYNNDITIYQNDTRIEYYTPYFAPQNLLIPVENDIFPNGLLGIGDVRDSIDLANGIATKRIGVVDLGSLNWTYYTSGTNPIFYTESNSIIPNTTANLVHNSLISNDYNQHANTTRSTFASNAQDKRYGFMSADRRIQVRDSSYTSAAAFKTAMSGVLLYYELETPTETTIAKAKAYYKVSANGKEIAVSEGLSAPLVADIAYRGMSAEDLINELNG